MKLENRKGVSFTMGHVMGLMLGILFLMFMGVFVASGSSPVKNSLMEGMGLIEEQVDRTVDVREPQTMSDLAMLSLHRATDEACKIKPDNDINGIVAQQKYPDRRGEGPLGSNQFKKWGDNDQEGYPGLKDSYLGEMPECTGASSTGAREGSNLRPGTELGMDMEGVYSRENFKIPEDANPITIDANAPDENWLNDHFALAAQKPLELAIKPKDQCDEYGGSYANFAVYFEDDVSNERSNTWVKDNDNLDKNGIYCTQGDNEHIKDYIDEGSRQVVLCPGDKGYVKANKVPDEDKGKPPTTDGEAGKNGITNLLSGFYYYPHIVITETTQEKCGEVETGQKPKIVNFEDKTDGEPEKYYVKFGMKNRRLSEKVLKAKIYSGDTKLKELDGKTVEPDSTKTEEQINLPRNTDPDREYSINCEEGLTIELHSKDSGGDSFEKVNQEGIPGSSVIPCNPSYSPGE